MSKLFKIIGLILLTASFNSTSFSKENFFNEALELFKKEKYEDARFLFERNIVFNPKNEKSYLFLSQIYNFKKQDKLEEKNLNTVILLNPKNEQAIYNLTLLKIKKSNYNETKKLIKDFKNVCKKLCEKTSDLQKKLNAVLEK